jgi:hypothetical protein
VPLSVHGDPAMDPLGLVKVTVPVGVVGVPVVSVTVAVHVADWPIPMVFGVQLTVVVVFGANVKTTLIKLCVASPS